MKWQPYPSYKDTGVEWLGRIPANWQVKRLKFLASQPLAYGANESAELNDPSQPRFIRITDIKSDGTLHDDTFRSLPEEVARPFLLKQGDLLLARSGATVGKTFMYRESWGRACHAGYLIRCRLNLAAANPEFVSYFATSATYWGWLSSVFIQATIQNVSAEKYANLFVPLPKLAEQQTIASFLDRETGKIDALVKKKERLIELLQEKRTALISHAVTQGLNPNAPKKDSGIPSLGHIPKHWEVRRLKFLLHRIDQGFSPVCANHPAENGQWGVLKAGCANGGVFDPTENKTLPDEIEPPLGIEVKRGDVLMSRASGSTELVGSVAIVRKAPPTRLLLSDKTFRLVLRADKIDPEFVVWAMGSPVLRHQISGVTSGAEGLASNIAKGDIYNLVFPLPPRHEQQELCARIGDETAKLDALMAKVQTAIERLQEYRTALISAAVTGQIDVRHCGGA